MTDEEKRIAIARACGWTQPNGVGWSQPGTTDGKLPTWALPDFLNSLDAMHEAEQVCLQQLIKGRYWLKLMEQEIPIPIEGTDRTELVGHWVLAARQRAEAFLKTIQS